MSDIIEWDGLIIPNRLRNMSKEMVDVYKKLEETQKEKDLRNEIPKIKSRMQVTITRNTDSLNKEFIKKAKRLTRLLRIVGSILLFIVLDIIYRSVMNNLSEFLYNALAIIFLTISIVFPILLIRPQKTSSRIRKSPKTIERFAEARKQDEIATQNARLLAEERLKTVKTQLNEIKKEQQEARELANRYSKLYSQWKDQAEWARIANIPLAREKSDIEIISEMVNYVSSNCFDKENPTKLIFAAADKYEKVMNERMALIKRM